MRGEKFVRFHMGNPSVAGIHGWLQSPSHCLLIRCMLAVAMVFQILSPRLPKDFQIVRQRPQSHFLIKSCWNWIWSRQSLIWLGAISFGIIICLIIICYMVRCLDKKKEFYKNRWGKLEEKSDREKIYIYKIKFEEQ